MSDDHLKTSIDGISALKKSMDDLGVNALKKSMDDLGVSALKKSMDDALTFKNPLDSLGPHVLPGIAFPRIDDMYRMPELPKMKSIWESQSELYMEGLQDQAQKLERSLQADEQLVMTCWHGNEKLQVMSVSMPSHNVVALHCVDADGNKMQITGHMSAVTFSFMVYKVKPPAKPTKIGFSMPVES